MFPGPLGQSLAGSALEHGSWAYQCLDIRDFSTDKRRSVDDTPFGGGAGMVLRPDVVDRAIVASKDEPQGCKARPLVYLTPRGKPFTQNDAKALASGPGVRLLCGRFEAIDQRVIDKHQPVEFSIGDYVVSGGEIAALVVLDAIVRLLPGVMGNAASAEQESFSEGLLEYPQYTRPQIWDGRPVPDILLSGHHGKIAAWREAEALKITQERRPDLLTSGETQDDRE